MIRADYTVQLASLAPGGTGYMYLNLVVWLVLLDTMY